jgi:hypothetical protein
VIVAAKNDTERDTLVNKLADLVLQDTYVEWLASAQGKANTGMSFEQWKATHNAVLGGGSQ